MIHIYDTICMYVGVRSHFGLRSILFDPTRIRSRIDWRNPPSGWITGSGRGPVGPPLNLERSLVHGSASTVRVHLLFVAVW